MRSDSASTVLVTGATGFIGLNLLHTLAERGYESVGIADRPLPRLAAESLARVGATPLLEEADVRDAESIRDIIERHQPDVVIHAAAVTAGVDRERSDARTIVDVNVGGTQSVLDAARHSAVDRVVLVSSGAVYGAATFGAGTLFESSHVEPVGLYGITKFAAEQLVRRHGDLHDVEIVIGRLSAVFGPWEYPTGVRDFMSPMLQLVRAVQAGESCRFVEDADRNWVYAPDAAHVLTSLAVGERPRFHCYNVCPEERGSVSELVDRLRATVPEPVLVPVASPDEATLTYDADPRLERAPVSGSRIREEVGDQLWSTHQDAFDAYLAWAAANPDWF